MSIILVSIFMNTLIHDYKNLHITIHIIDTCLSIFN